MVKRQLRSSFLQKTDKVIQGNRRRNKKVEVEDNEDPDFRAVSNSLKNAHEDILFEILLRLPKCESAISCGSVCRRWHSVISSPQFVSSFIRKHYWYSRPCYVIFCKAAIYAAYESLIMLFFENPTDLHGKLTLPRIPRIYSYFDFIPCKPSMILASCDDLLLVSSDASFHRAYYVCNLFTKQWSKLPKYYGGFPAGFAIVCNKQLGWAPHQYMVVLISHPQYDDKPDYQCAVIQVATLCSGPGEKWRLSYFSYPRPDEIRPTLCLDLITYNGILYWLEMGTECRIIELDVFNSSQCHFIYFPDDWQSSHCKVCLGTVWEALRLLQIFETPEKSFVMKVWELRYKDDDEGSSAWVLVHEKNMTVPDIEKLVGVSFQPNDSDVVYWIRDRTVYQYLITEDALVALYKFEEHSLNPGECVISFPLAQPLWPTPISSIPSRSQKRRSSLAKHK